MNRKKAESPTDRREIPQKQWHIWRHIFPHGFHNLYSQPDAILEAASVLVRAFVAHRAQERMQQVPVAVMDFDDIKPRSHSPFRGI
jgi:hypothetical protein